MVHTSIRGPFRRVLLKISGESFGSENPFQMTWIHNIAREIKQAHEADKEIGVVVGGGNIVRGAELVTHGIQRPTGDYMGMLATVINSLALQDILFNMNVDTRILTSRRLEGVGEPYHYQRCIRHLSKKRVVIFAGGTGSPFFTTDTAAALKAAEMQAEVFFKATKVDGVYTGDPKTTENVTKFDTITYKEILVNQYKIMDATAVAFCLENNIPILIFNLMEDGNFLKATHGENVGTLVTS